MNDFTPSDVIRMKSQFLVAAFPRSRKKKYYKVEVMRRYCRGRLWLRASVKITSHFQAPMHLRLTALRKLAISYMP